MTTKAERVYNELPDQPKEVIDAFRLDKSVSDQFCTDYLKQWVNKKSVDDDEHVLDYRTFYLTNSRRDKIPKFHKSYRKLNSKERRQLQLHSFSTAGLRYEDYNRVHSLWVQYMKDITKCEKASFDMKSKSLEDVLLRADYHGCLITVAQSKCPSLVGLKGIVIMESKETFKIITKSNEVKTIPKGSSVFKFRLGDYELKIYGHNFNYRATDRINRRFKSLNTIDL